MSIVTATHTNGTTNGKPASKPQRSPFDGRRIRGYHRWMDQWFYHPALRDGRFSQYDVQAMMQDDAVRVGTYASFGPIPGAKHEVRANSKEIKTFVENTLYRFWHHDLAKIWQHYFTRGTAIGEVMYERDADSGLWKYAGMDDFDMRDVQALRRGRHLSGVRVSSGGASMLGLSPTEEPDGSETDLREWNTIRHPKLFWVAHQPSCAQVFGNSAFVASWNSWMEKCGSHGAISIRKLWCFANAFRGCLVKYPPGATQRPDGTVVDNQDIARELAENASTGAAQFCPSETDEKGNPLWSIEDPKMNGDIKGLIEYPTDLDRCIWQGMGCLDEVIHAPDVGGSWSGRSGPLLIFLNICDMRVREVTTAFDVGPSGYTTRNEQAGGIIRPLVMENFGPKAKYEIRPISLVPKPAEPGAGGSPGSAPEAATGAGAAGAAGGPGAPGAAGAAGPMGPAPAAQAMGPPPQAVPKPVVALSGRSQESRVKSQEPENRLVWLSSLDSGLLTPVELPDADVDAILLAHGDVALSATWDEGKHHRGQPGNAGQFGSGAGAATPAQAAHAQNQKQQQKSPETRDESQETDERPTADGIMAKYKDQITAAIDKAPGGAWLRGKAQQAHEKIKQRYGEQAAKKIVASAVTISWGAFLTGPIVGWPLYIPVPVAMLPALVLAEIYKRFTDLDKNLSVTLSGADADLDDDEIERLAHELVEELTQAWQDHQGEDTALSAGWDESKHPHKGKGEGGGQFIKTGGGAATNQDSPEDEPAKWDGIIDQRRAGRSGRFHRHVTTWDFYDDHGDHYNQDVTLARADYDPNPEDDDSDSQEIFRWESSQDGSMTDHGAWTTDEKEAFDDGRDYAQVNNQEAPEEPEEREERREELHTRERRPLEIRTGKSKASVKLAYIPEQSTAQIAKIFGDKENAIQELASVVGAPDDAEVTVTDAGPYRTLYSDDLPIKADGVRVSVKHEKLSECKMFVGVDDTGKKFARIEIITVKKSQQGGGFATEMVAKMVDAGAENGLDYISLHAAGSPEAKMNGYYTWPRLGWDESVQALATSNPKLHSKIQRDYPESNSVRDILQSDEGAGTTWWKENGSDLHDARFDLKEGSPSRRILASYLEKRQQKHKAGAA